MTSGHGTTKSCAKINFHHRQDTLVSLHRQYNFAISEMFGRLSIRARYNLPRSRFKPIQISWIQNFGSEGGKKEKALPTSEVWRSKSSCIFANLALEDWLYRRYCMVRYLSCVTFPSTLFCSGEDFRKKKWCCFIEIDPV